MLMCDGDSRESSASRARLLIQFQQSLVHLSPAPLGRHHPGLSVDRLSCVDSGALQQPDADLYGNIDAMPDSRQADKAIRAKACITSGRCDDSSPRSFVDPFRTAFERLIGKDKGPIEKDTGK